MGAAPDPGLKAATSAASACSRLIEADGVVTPATPLSSLIGATNGLLTSNEFDGPLRVRRLQDGGQATEHESMASNKPASKAGFRNGALAGNCTSKPRSRPVRMWVARTRANPRSTGRSQEENRNVFNVSLVTFGHKELSERHLVAHCYYKLVTFERYEAACR